MKNQESEKQGKWFHKTSAVQPHPVETDFSNTQQALGLISTPKTPWLWIYQGKLYM